MRQVLASLALLAGCSSTPTSTDPDVDWDKFAPTVKQRIDTEAKAKDCEALQTEFDSAELNHHADLMGYVDAKMNAAGCYGG
jgi:hypothetical protein